MITHQIISYKNLSKTSNNNIHSTYDIYEYKAYLWIKNNIPKDTVILSDKQTMIQVNGIANKGNINLNKKNINLFEKEMQEILLMKYPEDSYYKISNLLRNESVICEKLMFSKKCVSYENRNKIIVIGEKTSNFAINGGDQWYVRNFRKFSGFDKFFNNTYFTLLYRDSNKVYVFEIN